MSVQEAEETLANAERAAKNAESAVLAASDVYRREQTPEAHAAVEAAERSARHCRQIVEFKRQDLERVKQAELEQSRAEAAKSVPLLLDELESERGRLGEVWEAFVAVYGELTRLEEFAYDLVVQDGVRREALCQKAEFAGLEGILPPALDLEVIRVAASLRLAEQYPTPATPDEPVPPSGQLAWALKKLAAARTYAQVATCLAEVAGHLAAEVGPTATDWLALAPRRAEPGSRTQALKRAALDLLERYGERRRLGVALHDILKGPDVADAAEAP